MRRYLPLFLAFCTVLPAVAQDLQARFVMKSQEIWNVTIRPRAPGTTAVQVTRADREGVITVNLNEVQRIFFDLSAIKPDTIAQLYYLGRYTDVVNALVGRINPYFAYVDQDANSNELVGMFIRALYLSGNQAAVKQAAEQVDRYATRGPVRRLSQLFLALSYIHSGDMEALAPLRGLLADPEPGDPLASAIWYGQAKLALSSNNWAAAHPPLALIITEAPLDTEWIGEALFLTARHHHSRTNLVVANQICQEILVTAPPGPWVERAEELRQQIEKDAKTHGITLAQLGEVRSRERQAGDAKIDYRERQRKLEEEARALREQLNQP